VAVVAWVMELCSTPHNVSTQATVGTQWTLGATVAPGDTCAEAHCTKAQDASTLNLRGSAISLEWSTHEQ
jgi:hypothetical protein